jgi:hypothetical protein
MNSLPPPLAFLVLVFAGWVNRLSSGDHLQLSRQTLEHYSQIRLTPRDRPTA